MGALVSFLGGSAFRALWSSVSGYFEKRQDHKYEIERMQLQNTLDDATATRAQAAIKQQAELGIKTIGVQADADVSRVEAEAFQAAMARAAQPTGIKWVDAWNGIIRPAYASCALALWLWFELSHMSLNAWVITPWSLDLIGTVAGFYFADRSLSKRGK